MSKPCIFFDRDGIVNEPPHRDRYVRSWEEFALIPAFLDALRVVTGKGYSAVIVTNQKGVFTGRMSAEDVDRIHTNLEQVLAGHGLRVADIVVCTAGDDDHPNRKPNPGMLFDSARKHDLDLSRSWMIGDQEKDVEAGKGAGCRTVRICDPGMTTGADFRVPGMDALAAFLEQTLPPAGPV